MSTMHLRDIYAAGGRIRHLIRHTPLQHSLHLSEACGGRVMLKLENQHFAKLFEEYHDVDHEVRRIEMEIETTSDEYLEDKKKQRLLLKDQLYSIIKEK